MAAGLLRGLSLGAVDTRLVINRAGRQVGTLATPNAPSPQSQQLVCVPLAWISSSTVRPESRKMAQSEVKPLNTAFTETPCTA